MEGTMHYAPIKNYNRKKKWQQNQLLYTEQKQEQNREWGD